MKFRIVTLVCLSFSLASSLTLAQQNYYQQGYNPYIYGQTNSMPMQQQSGHLWGSGYWGGQQGCSQNAMQSNFTSMGSMNQPRNESSQAQSEYKQKNSQKRSEIKKHEFEKKLIESKLERLVQKIEMSFDSEVSDFLIQTHFEKMNKCDDYKTFPSHKCTISTENPTQKAEIQALCQGKDEVPQKLRLKWTTESGGFCNAISNSERGKVSSMICSDPTLRSPEAPKYGTYSASECSQNLSEYRKNKLALDQLLSKIERAQDELADLKLTASDSEISERRQPEMTEAGCEECSQGGRQGNFQKSNRDWWSTAASVASGLGMIWYGNKVQESAQEYNAQLGYPTTSTSGSPYLMAGASMMMNGLTGNNCGQNMFGSMNGSMSGNMSAFSYPQNYNPYAQYTNSSTSQYYNPYTAQTYNPYTTQYYNSASNTQGYNPALLTPDQQVALLQSRIQTMNPYSTTYSSSLNGTINSGR
jgi:hypothetical protein